MKKLFRFMALIDQLCRKSVGKINRKYQRFFGWIVLLVDFTNGLVIKLIVWIYGYPNWVGEGGLHDLWLLVQHQDKRKQFQADMLEHMKFSAKDKVYLTDRVLVNQGKEQVYGTQFFRGKDGIFNPRPIKDEHYCDERRRSVGLGSLAEYRKIMNKGA